MNGKLIVGSMAVVGVVAGVSMYYLQVYGYYDELTLTEGDLRLTAIETGEPEAIPAAGITAIDANSSPLRFRACFTTQMSLEQLAGTYVPYDEAVPLNAPGWFDCFDAEAIGTALESGEALAFLGEKNFDYGVDRVVAVHGDGRAYVWHQLNNCGELAYDGTPVGEACPPRGEETGQ